MRINPMKFFPDAKCQRKYLCGKIYKRRAIKAKCAYFLFTFYRPFSTWRSASI